jgi:hypothetical protein
MISPHNLDKNPFATSVISLKLAPLDVQTLPSLSATGLHPTIRSASSCSETYTPCVL